MSLGGEKTFNFYFPQDDLGVDKKTLLTLTRFDAMSSLFVSLTQHALWGETP